MNLSGGSWDRDKAVELWQAGRSAGEIMAIVGATSRGAVLGYMHRNGIVRAEGADHDFWTEERTTSATKLWLAGETAAKIAAAFGNVVSRNAVTGRMHRLGVKKPAQVRIPKIQAAKAGTTAAPSGNALPSLGLVAKADATPDPSLPLKTLAEWGRHECCWPVGAADPARGQLYCGQPTPFGKSYCGDHNPNQSANLRTMKVKDETVRRARPEREACEIELTEQFA